MSAPNRWTAYERWAFEAGPLLMAFRGPLDGREQLRLPGRPQDIPGLLKPAAEPMHFTLEGRDSPELVPYLEIEPSTPFTCFPLFDLPPA